MMSQREREIQLLRMVLGVSAAAPGRGRSTWAATAPADPPASVRRFVQHATRPQLHGVLIEVLAQLQTDAAH